MPRVPMMNTNGEDRPAFPAISDEMKITPMVGEMNASEIAMALGSPRAFRFSWLSLVARSGAGAGALAAAMACLPSEIFVKYKEVAEILSTSPVISLRSGNIDGPPLRAGHGTHRRHGGRRAAHAGFFSVRRHDPALVRSRPRRCVDGARRPDRGAKAARAAT